MGQKCILVAVDKTAFELASKRASGLCLQHHAVLPLEENYEVTSQIPGLAEGRSDSEPVVQAQELPEGIKLEVLTEEGLQKISETVYSDVPPKWAPASAFKVMDVEEAGPFTKAAYVFLMQLDPDTPVVIIWD